MADDVLELGARIQRLIDKGLLREEEVAQASKEHMALQRFRSVNTGQRVQKLIDKGLLKEDEVKSSDYYRYLQDFRTEQQPPSKVGEAVQKGAELVSGITKLLPETQTPVLTPSAPTPITPEQVAANQSFLNQENVALQEKRRAEELLRLQRDKLRRAYQQRGFANLSPEEQKEYLSLLESGQAERIGFGDPTDPLFGLPEGLLTLGRVPFQANILRNIAQETALGASFPFVERAQQALEGEPVDQVSPEEVGLNAAFGGAFGGLAGVIARMLGRRGSRVLEPEVVDEGGTRALPGARRALGRGEPPVVDITLEKTVSPIKMPGKVKPAEPIAMGGEVKGPETPITDRMEGRAVNNQDPLLEAAKKTITSNGLILVNRIARRFNIPTDRAITIADTLEQQGFGKRLETEAVGRVRRIEAEPEIKKTPETVVEVPKTEEIQTPKVPRQIELVSETIDERARPVLQEIEDKLNTQVQAKPRLKKPIQEAITKLREREHSLAVAERTIEQLGETKGEIKIQARSKADQELRRLKSLEQELLSTENQIGVPREEFEKALAETRAKIKARETELKVERPRDPVFNKLIDTQQKVINRQIATLKRLGLSDEEITQLRTGIRSEVLNDPELDLALRQKVIGKILEEKKDLTPDQRSLLVYEMERKTPEAEPVIESTAKTREELLAEMDRAERRIEDIDKEIRTLTKEFNELAESKTYNMGAEIEGEILEAERLDKERFTPAQRAARTRMLTEKHVNTVGQVGKIVGGTEFGKSIRDIRKGQEDISNQLDKLAWRIFKLEEERDKIVQTYVNTGQFEKVRITKDLEVEVNPEVLEEFAEAGQKGERAKSAKGVLEAEEGKESDLEGLAYAELADAKIDNTLKFIREELPEVTASVTKKGERGAITFGRPRKPDYISPDAEIEAALTAHTQKLPALKALARMMTEPLRKISKALFVYEPLLEGNNKLIRDFRVFQDAPKDANKLARDLIYGVMGNLAAELDRLPGEAYEIFRRYIALQNEFYNAQKGLKTFRNITKERIEAEIQRLEKLFTPEIKKSLAKHQKLMKALWTDYLWNRGLVDTPEPDNPWYIQRQVLDYTDRWRSFLPWLPLRMKKPFYSYTKKRVGSVRDIDTDYIDVMTRYIMQLELDRAVEDFAHGVAGRTQISNKDFLEAIKETLMTNEKELIALGRSLSKKPLTDKQALLRALEFHKRPGRVFHKGDQYFKVWQFDPGRETYRGLSVEEDALAQIIDEAHLGQEVGDILEPPARQRTMLGRYKRMYVLPTNIADRLTQFRMPKEYQPVIDEMRALTSWWKRITTTQAFIPFYTRNFISDFSMLLLENPKAVRKIPQALRILTSELEGPFGSFLRTLTGTKEGQFRAIFEDLLNERILDAGQTLEFGFPKYDPRFRPFTGSMAGRTLRDFANLNPFNIANTIRQLQEGSNRVALYLETMETIRKGGKVPASNLVDISGLPLQDIPGAIGREALIDYGKVPIAAARWMRDLMFPWWVFHTKINESLIQLIKRNPKRAGLFLLGTYAGLTAWNHAYQYDVEKNLPWWMRALPHINTGFKTDDGRNIVVSLFPMLETLYELTGINKGYDLIQRAVKGELTPEEAGKEYLEYLGGAWRDFLLSVANPVITAMYDIVSNRDSFTKQILVKSGEESRKKEIWAKHLAKKIFTPFMHYVRFTDAAPRSRKYTFIDFPAGAGVRKVDPRSGKLERQFDEAGKRTIQLNELLIQYREAWVDYKVTGNKENLNSALENIKRSRVKPSFEQLQNIKDDIDTAIEIAKGRWKNARNQKDRERYEQEYFRLKDRKAQEGLFKRTRKAVRPFIEKEGER